LLNIVVRVQCGVFASSDTKPLADKLQSEEDKNDLIINSCPKGPGGTKRMTHYEGGYKEIHF
ncbi:hypothetical protein, partial [Acetobacter orientalis]|uniref:hypothetical protein n=1 Tax=Acetobacter orientalis TaxID=146474 RepID=UPI0039E9C27B